MLFFPTGGRWRHGPFKWRGFSAFGSRKRGGGGGIEESMGSSLVGGFLCLCLRCGFPCLSHNLGSSTGNNILDDNDGKRVSFLSGLMPPSFHTNKHTTLFLFWQQQQPASQPAAAAFPLDRKHTPTPSPRLFLSVSQSVIFDTTVFFSCIPHHSRFWIFGTFFFLDLRRPNTRRNTGGGMGMGRDGASSLISVSSRSRGLFSLFLTSFPSLPHPPLNYAL